MRRALRPHEHILLLTIFGAAFVYCLFGALGGSLYIPGKRGPGVELSGISAWLFVAAPLLLYSGILVRHQNLFPSLSDRGRNYLELSLLCTGVSVVLLALYLHPPGISAC